MPSALEWVVIGSFIVVVAVAAEFYLTDYRYRRSDISIHPADGSASTWRRSADGWIFDHRLIVTNEGPKPGVLEGIEIVSLSFSNGEQLTLDTQPPVSSAGFVTGLPDGPRIPVDYSGELRTTTRVWEASMPSDLVEKYRECAVELEFTISDGKGRYSIPVVDEIHLQR